MGTVLDIYPDPDREIIQPLYHWRGESAEFALYRTWSRVGNSLIADSNRARVEARVGQFLGFGIGVAALGCGLIAALHGAEWYGTFIGGGGVATLVAIFVYGRRSEKRSESAPK